MRVVSKIISEEVFDYRQSESNMGDQRHETKRGGVVNDPRTIGVKSLHER